MPLRKRPLPRKTPLARTEKIATKVSQNCIHLPELWYGPIPPIDTALLRFPHYQLEWPLRSFRLIPCSFQVKNIHVPSTLGVLHLCWNGAKPIVLPLAFNLTSPSLSARSRCTPFLYPSVIFTTIADLANQNFCMYIVPCQPEHSPNCAMLTCNV